MIRYLSIKTEQEFDAAHQVPGETKCNQLHGHTWKVEVEILGIDIPKARMMIDFLDLKKILNKFDHQNLNKYFKHPTAENLARYFGLRIWKLGNQQYPFLLTVRVKVFESPTSYAELSLNKEELYVVE